MGNLVFNLEGVIPLCGKIIYLLYIYNIFRRHNNRKYLINFNITYIIIFGTCFDFYESSSGINIKKCCTYCFTVLCLTVFLSNYCNRDPFFALQNQSQCLYGIREGCGW